MELGAGNDLVPEVATQVTGSAQIDFTFEELGEFDLHAGDAEEAWALAGLEFHEHVDVALGAEVVAEDRAEEGELADVVSPAELGDAVAGDGVTSTSGVLMCCYQTNNEGL